MSNPNCPGLSQVAIGIGSPALGADCSLSGLMLILLSGGSCIYAGGALCFPFLGRGTCGYPFSIVNIVIFDMKSPSVQRPPYCGYKNKIQINANVLLLILLEQKQTSLADVDKSRARSSPRTFRWPETSFPPTTKKGRAFDPLHSSLVSVSFRASA
jgi:hypothetical protein